MKQLPAILLPALLAPLLAAPSQPNDPVAADEFPGLQFLPVGSIVKGITIPRYAEHRAEAKFMAEELEVVSRNTVKLKRICALLYGAGNITTRLDADEADYNFADSLVTTERCTTLSDPRFTARGTRAVYASDKGRGILRGPVRTTLTTKRQGKESTFKSGTKAAPATPAERDESARATETADNSSRP